MKSCSLRLQISRREQHTKNDDALSAKTEVKKVRRAQRGMHLIPAGIMVKRGSEGEMIEALKRLSWVLAVEGTESTVAIRGITHL